MARPFPSFPRGGRPTAPRPAALLLEVPALSPQRQLHALRAFVKPHDWTREAVRHRLETDADGSIEQEWRDGYAPLALAAASEAAGRLGVTFKKIDRGEARLRLRFSDATGEDLSRAVAVVCSSRLPRTWWTLGRLSLFGGRFWRRERGRLLHLRPAADVHLRRDIRAAVRDLL